jgi:hypothetical protein
MPVNVSSLRAQITSYADHLAESGRSRQAVIEQLWRVFEPDFDAEALLATCLAASRLEGMRWSGALFYLDEAINWQFPFGIEPERYALVAADGSQIMPDRHKPILFAFIQAACACVIYGLGHQAGASAQALCADIQRAKPSRLLREDELFDDNGELLPPGEIANQRDVLEIELLADVCERLHAAGLQPILVADGSIVPFALLNERSLRSNSRKIDELLRPIEKALNRMRACDAIVAGYIDRSNSNSVVRACALSGVPFDDVTETRLRERDNWARGIFDRHVLERVLKPGHRTAMFDPNWQINDPRFLGRSDHAMRCCYANFGAGNDRQAIIARLELPAWCADDASVGTIAAVLQRHVRLGEGYPLILKASHEEAVVSKQDQAEIEQAIEQAMMARGIFARTSAKQEAKDRG